MSENRSNVCRHCGGHGKVPYRQTYNERIDEIRRAFQNNDPARALFLESSKSVITAMVCQPCDGTGREIS